jgi:hypothetical protein
MLPHQRRLDYTHTIALRQPFGSNWQEGSDFLKSDNATLRDLLEIECAKALQYQLDGSLLIRESRIHKAKRNVAECAEKQLVPDVGIQAQLGGARI